METNLFTIGMEKHIIFSSVACVFFLLQFMRTKRWYQLILAAAVPASLLVYFQPENQTWFYGVGIGEACLLLLAFIVNLVQSAKAKKEEKAKQDAAGTPAGSEA